MPAIIYGHGAETRHLSLPQHQLMLALKTPNALFRLEGLGVAQLALPKAVQRDPLKGTIEHVDLVVVRSGEKVTVEVPIRVAGDVFSGGILDQQLIQVSIQAEATSIPDGSTSTSRAWWSAPRCTRRTWSSRPERRWRPTRTPWCCTCCPPASRQPAAETAATEVPAPVAPAE